jgi:hypothetical protein
MQVKFPFRVDPHAADLAAVGLPGVDAHTHRDVLGQGRRGTARRMGRPAPLGCERVNAACDKEASSGLDVVVAVRRRAERCSAALVASANLNSKIRRFSPATTDHEVGGRSARCEKCLQAGHMRRCRTTTSHVRSSRDVKVCGTDVRSRRGSDHLLLCAFGLAPTGKGASACGYIHLPLTRSVTFPTLLH